MPIETNGKNLLLLPILVGPPITTCEISSLSSPSSTSAPMTQYGPIRHEEGIFAPRPTIAVACTLAAAAEDFIRLAVDDDAAEFGLAGELVAHVGCTLHASDVAAEGEHFNLDTELVAGRDLFAEFTFVDAGEQDQLRVGLELAHDEQPAGLSHGFHDEHARHDGVAGKVSNEVRLVHGHRFDGGDALAGFHTDDAIDQQEGIAVRQDLLYLIDVERDRFRSGRGDSGMGGVRHSKN